MGRRGELLLLLLQAGRQGGLAHSQRWKEGTARGNALHWRRGGGPRFLVHPPLPLPLPSPPSHPSRTRPIPLLPLLLLRPFRSARPPEPRPGQGSFDSGTLDGGGPPQRNPTAQHAASERTEWPASGQRTSGRAARAEHTIRTIGHPIQPPAAMDGPWRAAAGICRSLEAAWWIGKLTAALSSSLTGTGTAAVCRVSGCQQRHHLAPRRRSRGTAHESPTPQGTFFSFSLVVLFLVLFCPFFDFFHLVFLALSLLACLPPLCQQRPRPSRSSRPVKNTEPTVPDAANLFAIKKTYGMYTRIHAGLPQPARGNGEQQETRHPPCTLRGKVQQNQPALQGQ